MDKPFSEFSNTDWKAFIIEYVPYSEIKDTFLNDLFPFAKLKERAVIYYDLVQDIIHGDTE